MVQAQDIIGISFVEFFINGNSVEVDSSFSYSHNWNTTALVNGSQYTLSAQATDTSNNTTFAQPILVTISN